MLALLPEAKALNLQIPTRPTQFPLELEPFQQAGSVFVWGRGDIGQTNVPSGLTNIVQLACGYYHTVALKSDRTVVAWGYNGNGQINVPPGLTNVVQVAAGGVASAALLADGNIVQWGSVGSSQYNLLPNGLTNVVQVSVSDGYNVALKNDGAVVAWGRLNDVPLNLTNIVQVEACFNCVVALKADGSVTAWGTNAFNTTNAPLLTNVPSGLTNVVQISASQGNIIALKSDGTVVAWGDNTFNQTNVPNGLTNVVQVSAALYNYTTLLNDGTVVAWGWTNWQVPNIPALLTNVVQVSSGYGFDAAISIPPFVQVISPLNTIPPQVVGVPFTISTPVATSGLPVTLSIKSGPASINGNTITPTGIGTIVVAANQYGNSNYLPALEVTTSFTAKEFNQGISNFKMIPPKNYPCPPFAVTLPKATSGLPVTLSVISGPATVKGNTVTVTTAGVVVLGANQGGNSKYNPAPQVTTSFSVGTKTSTQKITPFKKIPNKTHGTSFTITLPTASSGLPVAVTVQSGNATINGNIVTLTGTGYVTLAADQGGNNYFNPAPEVTTTFFVQ